MNSRGASNWEAVVGAVGIDLPRRGREDGRDFEERMRDVNVLSDWDDEVVLEVEASGCGESHSWALLGTVLPIRIFMYTKTIFRRTTHRPFRVPDLVKQRI